MTPGTSLPIRAVARAKPKRPRMTKSQGPRLFCSYGRKNGALSWRPATSLPMQSLISSVRPRSVSRLHRKCVCFVLRGRVPHSHCTVAANQRTDRRNLASKFPKGGYRVYGNCMGLGKVTYFVRHGRSAFRRTPKRVARFAGPAGDPYRRCATDQGAIHAVAFNRRLQS
jgi:hypothetical protein